MTADLGRRDIYCHCDRAPLTIHRHAVLGSGLAGEDRMCELPFKSEVVFRIFSQQSETLLAHSNTRLFPTELDVRLY